MKTYIFTTVEAIFCGGLGFWVVYRLDGAKEAYMRTLCASIFQLNP